MKAWLQSLWENVRGIAPESWLMVLISLLCAALFAALFFLLTRKKRESTHTRTRLMIYGAMCVALSFLLSFIKLIDLPLGGSVTPASMFPLMAYGYMAGPVWGTMAGEVYFLLQLTQGVEFLTPLQFILDYILPFTLLGTLSGIMNTKKPTLDLFVGFAIAVLARYLCHFAAGAVFWGEYAPFNPWLYSAAYNAFVLVDAVPCFILAAIPQLRRLFARKERPLPRKE